MNVKTALLFLLLPIAMFSQVANDVDLKVSRKYKNYDSTKYQKFEKVLIVGVFQQYRNFNTTFFQKMNDDSSGLSEHVYLAESRITGGVVLGYDKFQFAIGTRNSPREEGSGKGYTKMFNLGLNIGDNRWVSENYYRRFQGFYNENTPSFDTSFARTKQYYLQPNLVSSMFMTRFMYFTNYINYSFKSGFGANFRQLKSSATWIVGGSINSYSLKNDSAIIPRVARPVYNDFANLKGFSSVNFSANFGGAATLVFLKAWFISGYFTIGPEQQWRSYDLTTERRKLSYISWSGTGRFSLGLNLKKFYFLASFSNDYNLYDSKALEFRSNSITNNVSIGWRFHVHTPKFYQDFMNSEIYQHL